jgi:hypothetical protein
MSDAGVALPLPTIYKSNSDPASSDYTGASSQTALRFVGGGANLRIEDCRLRFVETTIQSYGSGTYTNVEVRRNIVLDAWTANSFTTDAKIMGLYVSGVNGYLIEENFFDHNGWNETISNAGANQFNHNIYVQYDNKAGGIMRGNIFTRGAAPGLQARSGGEVDRNLFALNAVAVNMGGNGEPADPAAETWPNYVHDNVILNGRLMSTVNSNYPRTSAVWGVWEDYFIQGASIDGNIVANRIDSGSNSVRPLPGSGLRMMARQDAAGNPARPGSGSAWKLPAPPAARSEAREDELEFAPRPHFSALLLHDSGSGLGPQPVTQLLLERIGERVAGHHQHAPGSAAGIDRHFARKLQLAHATVLIEHLHGKGNLRLGRRTLESRGNGQGPETGATVPGVRRRDMQQHPRIAVREILPDGREIREPAALTTMVCALELSRRFMCRLQGGKGRIHLIASVRVDRDVHFPNPGIGAPPERAAMGEREMGHVEVVFDLPPPARRKGHRGTDMIAPFGIVELGHRGQLVRPPIRERPIVEFHPNETIAFRRAIGLQMRQGEFVRIRLEQRGDRAAGSVRGKAPSVVRTDQLAVLHTTGRQPGSLVRARHIGGQDVAIGKTSDDQLRLQQRVPHDGARRKRGRVGDRLPGAAQRLDHDIFGQFHGGAAGTRNAQIARHRAASGLQAHGEPDRSGSPGQPAGKSS